MGVLVNLGYIVNGAGRNPSSLQKGEPLSRLPLKKDRVEGSGKLPGIPDPVGIGQEAGVLGKVLPSEDPAQLLPGRLICPADANGPVLRLEDLVGGIQSVGRISLPGRASLGCQCF